jgi:biotin operon repressor
MTGQLSARSDFAETFAVHVALKVAVKSKQYDRNPGVKKAAEALCKDLESERSIYGRQLKMIAIMEKGASIAEIGRKLHSSRRTVFRYLNHLEEAGISLSLEQGKYYVDKGVVRMLQTQ